MQIREDVVMDAREWLADEVPPAARNGEPIDMDDDEVVAAITEHYEGGIEQFQRDYGG